MIRRIEVKAFKSLQDISVELGLVNVLIGANGSGKSNFLEAIGILGAAASGRVDDEGLLRRGVRPGVPVLYKTSFHRERTRNAIRFGAFSEGGSYEAELTNPSAEPMSAWSFKSEKWLRGDLPVVGRSRANKDYLALNQYEGLAALKAVEIEPSHPASQLLRTLREFAIYSPNTAALRGLIPDPQQREPVGLFGGRIAEAVEDIIRLSRENEHLEEVRETWLDLTDWVKNIGVGFPHKVPLSSSVPRPNRVIRFQDRFMAENRDTLSAYDASEGILFVLFASVLINHPKSPLCLAIDNVDSALNPRLARELLAHLSHCAIVHGQRQILLTCHNPLALDGLDLRDDRIRLFAVDRSAKGKTQIRRVLVEEGLWQKINEGWTLSRLWVAGHLGGVPNV